MFTSDIADYGYEAGTFKLGQKLYSIKNVEHTFWLHKECPYCKSTGKIMLQDRIFTCPCCNGQHMYETVIEKVVGNDTIPIKSILSFKNRNKHCEIYVTDSSGYGMIIQKSKDGTSWYFETRQAAQEVCDEYNSRYGVNDALKKYRENKLLIKEQITNY